MLTTIFLSILAFGALFSAMAIGVILSNKPVKGSCGGLGAAGLSGDCDMCGGKPENCEKEEAR